MESVMKFILTNMMCRDSLLERYSGDITLICLNMKSMLHKQPIQFDGWIHFENIVSNEKNIRETQIYQKLQMQSTEGYMDAGHPDVSFINFKCTDVEISY